MTAAGPRQIRRSGCPEEVRSTQKMQTWNKNEKGITVRPVTLFLILSVIGLTSCARKSEVNAPQGNARQVNAPQGNPCTPPATSILNTPLRAQETDQWCWAASGQMIMSFLNHDVGHCVQANNELDRTDWCLNVKAGGWDHGGMPEFEQYKFGLLP